MNRFRMMFAMISVVLALSSGLAPGAALGQVLRSTGSNSGLRMWYPASNDWWLDPSQGGRLDILVNGDRLSPVVSYLSTGRVGVGTTNPQATLDVENPTAAGSFVIAASTSGLASPILVVSNGGKVGIGTMNPSASLEVQGGPIKAGGGLIIQTLETDPLNPTTGQMWLVAP